VNVLSRQLRVLSDAIAQRHASEVRRTVDRRADALRGGRNAPLARLRGLRDLVAEKCEASGTSGRYLVPELDFAAALLRSELEKGASCNESRIEALLSAAVALGAWWFIDSRLLELRDFFSPAGGPPNQPSGLLALDLGKRFELATAQAQSRSVAATHALKEALKDGCSQAAMRALCEAVFDAQRPDALAHFMNNEKLLLQHARIAAPSLQTLCLAGDLAFGMGRCVRLLSQFCPNDTADQRVGMLTGMIHGLVDEFH